MDIYLIVIFVAIMGAAILWFWKIRHQHVNALASIVIVIGVLGTFCGIAIGLYQFDTEEIAASIPQLLEGLKIAFITSISGIIGSIVLKWSALNNRKRQAASEETYTGTTVGDLAELLQNILTVEQKEGKETRETLLSIERSLTGEGDSTVLTQLQKLRTTFSDKQDDLIRAFNEFADQMAENNTNALIEALEEVMRDFNAKINEQFGENFQQLNEAVGRINEWQQQYRQQMDELAAQFQVAAASIEQSRESLEIIAERSGAIVSNSETLNPILQALQHQIQRLEEHLAAFGMLADNARSAFPIIEGRLNQLTNDFSTTVQETIDDSHASMQSQRKALTNQSELLQRMQEQTEVIFRETTIRIENVIDSTFQGLRESLEDQSQQLQSIVTETNQGLTDTLQNQSTQLDAMVERTRRIFQKSSTRMDEQIRFLDAALEEELTKALESLGSQLTSLSERFVKDYDPLTEKLRAVVQIASSLPQPQTPDSPRHQ